MEEKCRAIVLRAVDYKDNDKILTLFSLERGVISSAIRGVKKPKAKLKFAAQPFCFCEYVFNVKGDKRSVISADIIESFYPLREDVLKFYAGAVGLEFVLDFVQEEQPSGEMFLLLMEFLKNLCYTDVKPRIALAGFLFGALAYTGYELSVDGCIKCREAIKNRAFFDFNLGASVCEDCHENTDVEINPDTLKLLAEISGQPLDGLVGVDYPLMIQNKAIKLLCYYAQVKAGVSLRSVGDLLTLK